jgi:putative transposase
MWQANPTWGSPRIVGEPHKLGIDVSKSTVETYRVRPHRPPSPTWKTFLKNHMQDLVSLDFFVVPTVHHTVLFVPLISLAEIGKKRGRYALTEAATIVRPETILACHRKLTAQKFDGSLQRK